MRRIITLLTDFGTKDGFVGTMKGVILGINPEAEIVDISHDISSHNIQEAAFVLYNCQHYFPLQTIHVVVVDPGVGSQRRIIGLRTHKYYFLAPDNGVLKYIFHEEDEFEVREITNRAYFLENISRTFHGRDIFAPVAAHLSLGVSFESLGEPIDDFIRGEVWKPEIKDDKIVGRIIYIDRFGNLITNLNQEILENIIGKEKFEIQAGNWRIKRFCTSYSEGVNSEPLAIIGSSGFLEIAVKSGSAKETLGLKAGDFIFINIIKE